MVKGMFNLPGQLPDINGNLLYRRIQHKLKRYMHMEESHLGDSPVQKTCRLNAQ